MASNTHGVRFFLFVPGVGGGRPDQAYKQAMKVSSYHAKISNTTLNDYLTLFDKAGCGSNDNHITPSIQVKWFTLWLAKFGSLPSGVQIVPTLSMYGETYSA